MEVVGFKWNADERAENLDIYKCSVQSMKNTPI
jgi:hypothetical protein